MGTPTHFLKYSKVLFSSLITLGTNKYDTADRSTIYSLKIPYGKTPSPRVLTADLISTTDQTSTVRTFPLRKDIQESAGT